MIRALTSRARVTIAAGAAVAVAAAFVTAPATATVTPRNHYRQVNWVSDQPGHAMITDSNLVNPWGLSFGPTTPVWAADNGKDVSTLYSGGNGTTPPTRQPLVVGIPDGAPTGTVFNPTKDFDVRSGTDHAAARFLFASEAGVISGWAPNVPAGPNPSTQAQVAMRVPGAIYKGLTLVRNDEGNFLLAPDFHNARVDVFTHSFHRVRTHGLYVDRNIPAGYAPFNVQALKGRVYVTYAKQDADKEDEIAGNGLGFLDVFDTHGRLIKRLVSRGALNAPWGLAIAPHDFGRFSDALLVGNFGNGRINAFDRHNGAFLGTLHDTHGHNIVIDGLWAIAFGNGVAGTTHSLLFSAGPDDESHGLLGAIEPAP